MYITRSYQLSLLKMVRLGSQLCSGEWANTKRNGGLMAGKAPHIPLRSTDYCAIHTYIRTFFSIPTYLQSMVKGAYGIFLHRTLIKSEFSNVTRKTPRQERD